MTEASTSPVLFACFPPVAGYVTTVHVTDEHLDGPPAKEWCLLSHLRELDLDGGNQNGPFPEWVINCLPFLQELDMSYNRVCGCWRGGQSCRSAPPRYMPSEHFSDISRHVLCMLVGQTHRLAQKGVKWADAHGTGIEGNEIGDINGLTA